jgi:hypothetical protein
MERNFVAGTFPPEHRGAPTISGTPTVGQTLAATNGNWTNSPSSYAYQWLRGSGAPFTSIGSNSANYLLVAGDSGQLVRCAVSAVNAAGTTVGPPSDPLRIS